MADIIWLCGRPSSGKTTLAQGLIKLLHYKCILLDGDEVRRVLSPDLRYTEKDRHKQMQRVANIGYLINKSGVNAIICTCSPPSREDFENLQGYIEVYVKCSLSECERRDVKRLYKKARKGEINNMPGVDQRYGEALCPDLIIDTEKNSPKKSINELYDKLIGLVLD